ncbi:MAG TPA: aldolase/citrate lyase family protein [Burkholderiales bacterium]|nr:aldolase/citrate lyase family protein [Burkholderiales bacterium]
MKLVHPSEALFKGEKPFPVIPSCEHFAGSEKLIVKALELQDRLGPIFDITCDCEDGAQAGREKEHAEMVARVLGSPANKLRMAGVRIHDYTHPAWKQDIDVVVSGAGSVLAYITIPKATSAAQVAEMIIHVEQVAAKHGVRRQIPIHALVETHGALHDAAEIARLPGMQVLDFGLMDFVSGHHGAIPAAAMRSPGQFDHKLLARAKTEVVAAALAHGVIPAHNVTLDLKNTYQTYQDAWRARHEFGFLRMWSIYPAQIQPIVDAMKPDYSEVQDAAAILLAAQQAEWGPIQYAGELHDRATYRYFWEILQKAKVTGVDLPAGAAKAFF